MNARVLVVVALVVVVGWVLVRALTKPAAPPPTRVAASPRPTAIHAPAAADRGVGTGSFGAAAAPARDDASEAGATRGVSADLAALAHALDTERSPELYVFPN